MCVMLEIVPGESHLWKGDDVYWSEVLFRIEVNPPFGVIEEIPALLDIELFFK